MKLKEVLILIMSICIVLMFVTDAIFYQQQAGKIILIILGVISLISGLIMVLTDEDLGNEEEDEEL